MLKVDAVTAGNAVLGDSMRGLADRLVKATPAAKYQPLASKVGALKSRIIIAQAKWFKTALYTGLPYYIWASDLCMQQLNMWAAELQQLWSEWAELSGEPPVAIAKPKERILGLDVSMGHGLEAASKLVWSMVALGVLGLAGWFFYRRWAK